MRTVYIQSINPYLKKSKEAYQKLFTKLGLASHMTSFHCLETGVLSEKSTELLFQEVSSHCTDHDVDVDIVGV